MKRVYDVKYWEGLVKKYINTAVCKDVDGEYRIHYNESHLKYFGKGNTELAAWRDAMNDLNKFSA